MTDTSGTGGSGTGGGSSSIDVVSLLKDGMARFQSGLSSTVGQVNSLVGTALGANKKAQEATVSEAEAKASVAAAQGAADSKKEADNKATEAALGTLPGAASWLAANVRDTVLPKQIQLQKDQDELEAAKRIGPLDDFGAFVMNSFTAPFKEESIKQQKEDIDQRLGFSQKVTTLTNDTLATNAASDVVDATAKADALSKEAFAQSAIQASELQDRATQLGISAAQTSQAATVQSLDVAFKYTNMLFEQNRDNYMRIEADLNMATKQATMAHTQLETKIMSENEEDKQASFKQIQAAALPNAGIKLENFQQFKLLDKEKQDALVTLAANSEVSNSIDPFSPTKSINLLSTLGSSGPSPGVIYVTNKLKDISNPIDVGDGYRGMKEDDKIPLKDQEIKNAVTTELKNIKPVGGIYSPLSLSAGANLNPVIQSLPLIKEMVAGGLTKDESHPTNPDDFFATGLAQVKRGVPVGDVAAQITAYFQTMSSSLNDTRRFSLVRIPGLAPAQPYNMSVHAPPEFSQTIKSMGKLPPIIDMNNQAAVANYLSRLAAAQRMQNAAGGINPFVKQ